MNKARIAAADLPAGLPARLLFAAAAMLLALLALPHAGHGLALRAAGMTAQFFSR
ncbi:hypothetical protein [Bradyrhizobium sp. USDA 4486]